MSGFLASSWANWSLLGVRGVDRIRKGVSHALDQLVSGRNISERNVRGWIVCGQNILVQSRQMRFWGQQ
jgi:hypothetical protein